MRLAARELARKVITLYRHKSGAITHRPATLFPSGGVELPFKLGTIQFSIYFSFYSSFDGGSIFFPSIPSIRSRLHWIRSRSGRTRGEIPLFRGQQLAFEQIIAFIRGRPKSRNNSCGELFEITARRCWGLWYRNLSAFRSFLYRAQCWSGPREGNALALAATARPHEYRISISKSERPRCIQPGEMSFDLEFRPGAATALENLGKSDRSARNNRESAKLIFGRGPELRGRKAPFFSRFLFSHCPIAST